MVIKCAAHTGCTPNAHAQLLNWPGQASHSVACGRGRDLADDDGQVYAQGGRTGGEGALWDRANVQGGGGINRGGHSCECVSCGCSTPKRRTGDSSLLTLLMRSMMRIGWQCWGPSNFSGLVEHSLLSTAIATGSLWWCTMCMGQANYCTASKT